MRVNGEGPESRIVRFGTTRGFLFVFRGEKAWEKAAERCERRRNSVLVEKDIPSFHQHGIVPHCKSIAARDGPISEQTYKGQAIIPFTCRTTARNK